MVNNYFVNGEYSGHDCLFLPSQANLEVAVFAYSESKLTCHFVLVVLLVVLLVLGGKRSEKVGKRSKKVASS